MYANKDRHLLKVKSREYVAHIKERFDECLTLNSYYE